MESDVLALMKAYQRYLSQEKNKLVANIAGTSRGGRGIDFAGEETRKGAKGTARSTRGQTMGSRTHRYIAKQVSQPTVDSEVDVA